MSTVNSYFVITLAPFGDLHGGHQAVISSSSGEGFKIQVTPEAGNYELVRSLE